MLIENQSLTFEEIELKLADFYGLLPCQVKSTLRGIKGMNREAKKLT